MLELQGVCAGYGGQKVLHSVSLKFPEGGVSVIAGVNGSGKSTLLQAIAGVLPVQSGAVWLDSQPVSNWSSRERAKRLAYLPQSREVPDLTVGQMVLHGRFPHLTFPRRYRKEDWERAHEALVWVEALEWEHRLVATLSGGERQRVYLAMALAQDSDVILLDEPTTHLDIQACLEMMKLVRRLADRGKQMILVLHDVSLFMQYADFLVLLQGGQVVGQGAPEQLWKQGSLSQVFGVEIERVQLNGGSSAYVCHSVCAGSLESDQGLCSEAGNSPVRLDREMKF